MLTFKPKDVIIIIKYRHKCVGKLPFYVIILLYDGMMPGGEENMHPEFGIKREKQNNLFYMEYTDDEGPFHFHSQIELYFVDDGEMEMLVNNHSRKLHAGELSVALSYDAHAYKTPESSGSSVFIIPSFMCEEFIAEVKCKRVSNPFITDRKVVRRIKEYIREINSGKLNPIAVKGYIYLILGIINDNLSFEQAEEAVDTRLSSGILFYINENFRENITLNSISAHFGFSPGYISRYFKACFNIGINRYITVIRLKNALALMRDKKNSFTYCAMESGFNSMRTFYRVFLQEFGCSPGEYLEDNKKLML